MDPELVGRDQELADLSRWLEESRRGRGAVVLVGGDAGIGKSRLVAAVAEHARSAGHLVLSGRTTEQDGAPPYWPWFQVLEPLGARARLEAPAGDDPESERFARFDEVSAALVSAPALVVLEDVHRADPASLRLLAHFAARVSTAPVLLVVTYRTNPADQVTDLAGVLDELIRAPEVRRLDLRGLEPADVGRLLGAQATAEAAQRVWAASGGNPLYVGELARHLAAGGDLATVPRSVRDAIRVRLAQRSEGCVEAVRVGAVIGRTFGAGLVATVTGRAALPTLHDLDEAVDAGLIEPIGTPGELRFVHALVRDAVEASLGTAELPLRHRLVAEAIEAYDGTGDAQLADLARHWDAASALGDRETAAQWCERAAVLADRQLAWEEAARLFERAVELGGPAAAPLHVYQRSVGSARARLHCDKLTVTIARCVQAAEAARVLGRPDLMAEAVLVPEGRALSSAELRDFALEALGGLSADDHARRARLHGHLTHIGLYLDPESMVEHCDRAEAEAAEAGDPLADLAAIRARHTLLYGAEHAAERLALAERFGRAARQARRPSVALWEPLWRIDALAELGRLPEAVATMSELRRAVSAAGSPIARWHLARVEAALAQAAGRFADAVEHALEARRLFSLVEDPFAAEGIYLGFRIGVEMHAGWTAGLAEGMAAIYQSSAAPFYIGDLPVIGVAMTAAGIGDVEQARAAYDRMAPAQGWNPPQFVWLDLYATRICLAARLGVRADLPPLLEAIDPYRGVHVAGGGGIVNYLGPVELWLGIGAAALGRWDEADRDLATAADQARAAGAPSFAVHAHVERAEALLGRGGPGDARMVRTLLDQVRPIAVRLGMPGFLQRIDAALARLAIDGPLSPRELEVAGLVAEGRTNKEIATELYLSERTAQNHVQHILTKLGFDNRTQVAAWYRDR